MKKIPYWIQGGLFMLFLIILIFFLKATCPSDTGCFADPFVSTIFLPFYFIYNIFQYKSIFLMKYEPLLIFIFWITIGVLVGFIVERLKKVSDRIYTNKKDILEKN